MRTVCTNQTGCFCDFSAQSLCNAILVDDKEAIAQLLHNEPTYKAGSWSFSVKMHSRAGHILRSNSCTVGHLLALFASQRSLHHLHIQGLLTPSQFRVRMDLHVEYNHSNLDEKEHNSKEKETLRRVPPSHCAALRDNWPALLWLLRNSYISNVKEMCAQGRNLLHVAVIEESPHTLRHLLQVNV